MNKQIATLLFLLLIAVMAIPAAQAATMTEKVAKAVCSSDTGTYDLDEQDMQYYVANDEYEGMFQEFTEDKGIFASYKKTKNPQSSFCKRVVYGKDKNGVWQKQGVYTANTVLKGKTLSAPAWTKTE